MTPDLPDRTTPVSPIPSFGSLEDWTRQHGGRVLAMLRRIVHRERADVLLMESFRQVHAHLAAREQQGKAPLSTDQVRGRLLVAARELALAETAKPDAPARPTIQESDTFPMPGDAGAGPESPSQEAADGGPGSGDDARSDRVHTAFASLETGERRLVERVVVDGEDLEGAARQSGLPVAEARSRLLAAMRRFRAALERQA